IRTAMVEALPEDQVKYMTDKIPMKRCGTLEEIAHLAAFIVSPGASFTTGFTFDMTGGRSTYWEAVWMGLVKQFFSDLFAILFMGVGISTLRTKQKKFDLRRLVSNEDRGPEESRGAGERWNLVNRAASSVEYRNQEAVRFDSRPGPGLAWVEGLRFSVGKIDLNIAAAPQDVGIAFHVQNEREFEAVCFHVGDEARDEGASQRVIVQYLSTDPDRNANHEAQFD